MLRNWFKLRVHCGNCGLRLERGEHDYFSGSILLSYSVGTVVFAIVLTAILVSSWPNVPWGRLEIVLALIVLVFPFAFFPFSKLLWLSADIIMRPVSPQELEWHRGADSAWSTSSRGH